MLVTSSNVWTVGQFDLDAANRELTKPLRCCWRMKKWNWASSEGTQTWGDFRDQLQAGETLNLDKQWKNRNSRDPGEKSAAGSAVTLEELQDEEHHHFHVFLPLLLHRLVSREQLWIATSQFSKNWLLFFGVCDQTEQSNHITGAAGESSLRSGRSLWGNHANSFTHCSYLECLWVCFVNLSFILTVCLMVSWLHFWECWGWWWAWLIVTWQW